jgi:hypothetical protein
MQCTTLWNYCQLSWHWPLFFKLLLTHCTSSILNPYSHAKIGCYVNLLIYVKVNLYCVHLKNKSSLYIRQMKLGYNGVQSFLDHMIRSSKYKFSHRFDSTGNIHHNLPQSRRARFLENILKIVWKSANIGLEILWSAIKIAWSAAPEYFSLTENAQLSPGNAGRTFL